MCFSAAGSFVVAGVMAGIGTASLARSAAPHRRMFAAIPLLFAAQQVAEGIVWRTLPDADQATLLHRSAVNVFLAFALVVWPIWSPGSLLSIEREPTRRRVLAVLLRMGILVAVGAGVLLVAWQPRARVAVHSICYEYGYSGHTQVLSACMAAYVVPTVVPFFVSTARLSRTIGAMLVVSLITAIVVKREALTSVWCFFAAILSGLVLVAVVREARRDRAAAR